MYTRVTRVRTVRKGLVNRTCLVVSAGNETTTECNAVLTGPRCEKRKKNSERKKYAGGVCGRLGNKTSARHQRDHVLFEYVYSRLFRSVRGYRVSAVHVSYRTLCRPLSERIGKRFPKKSSATMDSGPLKTRRRVSREENKRDTIKSVREEKEPSYA